MSQQELLQNALQDLVGEGHVQVRQGRFYVEPADEEEVARVLALCNQHQLGVVPQGNGSQSGLGGLLQRQDLVLSVNRMNRVLDYSPADLTVTVQAGVTLHALQEELQQSGQWLALDPVVPDSATIGGLIATNASGPKRILYGALRDQVIGMRIAYPDGRLIKTGGKVVKNVAGYDIGKLFIGSLGTLGVVVEATLKVRPLPSDPELVLIGVPSLAQAHQLQKTIRDSELIPSALELLSPPLAAAFWESSDTDGGVKDKNQSACYTLVVGCDEGKSAAVYQRQRLYEMAREMAEQVANAQVRILQGKEVRAFWQAYRQLILANGQLPNGRFLQVKASLLPMHVVPFLEVATALQPHPFRFASSSGLGTGIVRLFIDTEHLSSARIVSWLTALRTIAEQRQGALVLEKASDEYKQIFPVWGSERPDFALMKGIKQAIDPQFVLNAGRFVGGM